MRSNCCGQFGKGVVVLGVAASVAWIMDGCPLIGVHVALFVGIYKPVCPMFGIWLFANFTNCCSA